MPEEFNKMMEELIYQTDKPCGSLKYVVEPIYSDLKVIFNKDKTPDMTLPRHTLNFLFDKLALVIEERQYRDIVFVVQKFTRYSDMIRYHRFRPIESVGENARAWWLYAYRCVQLDLNEKKKLVSWSHISNSLRGGREYMMLYSRKVAMLCPLRYTISDNTTKLSNKGVGAADKESLDKLEEELPYDTILL